MPIQLSPAQKVQVVQAHGFDPSQWTTTDDGSRIINASTASVNTPVQNQPASEQTNTVSATPNVVPDPNAPEAFVKTAIHEAPAAAGAGVGAGTGAALGAEAGAFGGPFDVATVPIGALIGMLAGGYVGGKTVKSVQDVAEQKFAPDYLKELKAAQAQHPIAANLGALADLPLSGMSPNPKNIVRAGGALAKIFGSEGGATPEELSHLVNVAGGGIIGGVQSAVQGGSPSDIAENAGVGALFNSPNAIGKTFGFHPVQQRTTQSPDGYAQMLSSPTTGENIVQAQPDMTQNGKTGYTIPDVSSTSTGIPVSRGSTLAKSVSYLDQTGTVPSEVTTMEAEGAPPIESQQLKQLTQQQKDIQAEQQKVAGVQTDVPEQKDLINQYQTWLKNKLDEASKESDKYQGSDEGIQPKNQEPQKENLLTPSGIKLQEDIKALKVDHPNLDISRISPDMINTWASEVSKLHGLDDQSQPGLINPQTGKPVKGTAFVGSNRTAINPDIADAGTQAHENFHHIFNSMPDDAKNQLLKATKPELDKFNAQRRAAGQPEFDHEEYLATEMGYKSVSRLLNTQFETPLKQWWRDFKSGAKIKFGMNPTVDDLYRNNVYKLVHGKSDIPNLQVSRPQATIQKNQSDDRDKKPQFIGEQQDFSGKSAPFKLYNLKTPITDETGKVLHDTGSTVSENTLKKYGVKYQEGDEGIKRANMPSLDVNQARYEAKKEKMRQYKEANRDAINADRRVLRNNNLKENQAIGASRTAGIAPHTYPQDVSYTPPPEAPPRRVPAEMNEADETVATKAVTKGLNRLFYKNMPMTMIKQWNSDYMPELRDKALMDLRTTGLDVPKNVEGSTPSKHEMIASSGLRRATEQFNNWTKEFKEQHGHQTSLDTAGAEGAGIQDKIGHVPSTEITSKTRETTPTGTAIVGKTDTKRIGEIKTRAEKAAKGATVGQAKDILQDMYEQSLDNEDDKASAHYKTILDMLEKRGDDEPIDLMKLQEASKLMEDEGKTKGIGNENESELNKLKFQGENEGLTRKVRNNPDTTPSQKYNFLRLMPELDQARRHAGPEHEDVARALQQLPSTRDEMYGRYTAPIFKLSKGMSLQDKNKVAQILYHEDTDGLNHRNLLTTEKQRSLYDETRKQFVAKQNDQVKAEQLITDFDAKGKKYTRQAQINPTYAPSMMRPDIIQNILERTPAGKRYEQQLLDYWKAQGATEETAKKRLLAIKQMENSDSKNETRFGANRMTEGMGIPSDLRIKDFDKMINRYYSKVATDRSWHDVIEKNETVNEKLQNNEDVQHHFGSIVDKIKGEPFDKDTGIIKAWNKMFTSALLGPLTNVHIGMSTFFNPFQYVKGSELASVYGKGMSHLGESYDRALSNGYKRGDFNTIHDIVDSQNTFIQRASAVSSLIGRVNGREFTDKVAKTFAQAIGEEIVPLRIADAKTGDAWSIKLMKQLDPSWSKDKTYSPIERSQLASTLGGLIHGSHDYRTLPELMNRENVLKPFVSLMSWSVAQTNQWMKHVYEPAMTGNVQPLIMSTLGALVGGYVIQQMRQGVSDKKSNIPSLTEILKSSRGAEGNIPLLAYNFMQMASYTGFMGLGSTAGKYVFDAAYKNIPQGATFPLDEAIGNIGSTMHDAVSAYLQTPDTDSFFRIFPKALLDMAKENYQLARIATSWAADYKVSGETEAYKKTVNTGEQDLRRYRMAEGLPFEQQTGVVNNPYLNMQSKEFKRTENIGEAVKDLPPILSTFFQRARGNPDVLRNELTGLKQNSYQTMPSPQTMPMQFAKYYRFLAETQGPEVAQERMKDYMMHEAINKAKSQFVPTF